MRREVFERELSAAMRYLEMAAEHALSVKEVESLLRLARTRLNGCQTEIRETGLEPPEETTP